MRVGACARTDRVLAPQGSVPERPKGTGCKPVVISLRWFKSILAHSCESSSGLAQASRGSTRFVSEPTGTRAVDRTPALLRKTGVRIAWALLRRIRSGPDGLSNAMSSAASTKTKLVDRATEPNPEPHEHAAAEYSM